MTFVQWLFCQKPQKKSRQLKFGESTHERWRAEEEERQLEEVRERLERVEQELMRIKGTTS